MFMDLFKKLYCCKLLFSYYDTYTDTVLKRDGNGFKFLGYTKFNFNTCIAIKWMISKAFFKEEDNGVYKPTLDGLLFASTLKELRWKPIVYPLNKEAWSIYSKLDFDKFNTVESVFSTRKLRYYLYLDSLSYYNLVECLVGKGKSFSVVKGEEAIPPPDLFSTNRLRKKYRKNRGFLGDPRAIFKI